MVLQEELVQMTVLDNIITACTKTLPFAVGFTVEGSLKILLTTEDVITIDVNQSGEGTSKYKKRIPTFKKNVETDTKELYTSPESDPTPKRKRGRPRKVSSPKPAYDDDDDDNDTVGYYGENDDEDFTVNQEPAPVIKEELVDAVAKEVAENASFESNTDDPGMKALQSLALQLSGDTDTKAETTDMPPALPGDPEVAETSGGKCPSYVTPHTTARLNSVILFAVPMGAENPDFCSFWSVFWTKD
jgi:hypothetical protein